MSGILTDYRKALAKAVTLTVLLLKILAKHRS